LFKNWGSGTTNTNSSDRKRKRQLRRYIREGEDLAEEGLASSTEA